MRKPGRSAQEISHVVVVFAVPKNTGACTESPSFCRWKDEMEEVYTYTFPVDAVGHARGR
jgi:hypothetical protein